LPGCSGVLLVPAVTTGGAGRVMSCTFHFDQGCGGPFSAAYTTPIPAANTQAAQTTLRRVHDFI
jgi:hypothetical protein